MQFLILLKSYLRYLYVISPFQVIEQQYRTSHMENFDELSPSMVTVNHATKSRRRFATHYVIMFIAGFLLCGTVLIIVQEGSSSRSSSMRGAVAGVDAHSAKALINKPHLVYGTAWKAEGTAKNVHQAVKSGFRFIDTACQPKHYNEAGVGNGWTAATQELGLNRDDIWLQTKFSPIGGQDPDNLPYDKDLTAPEQAQQSLAVSLKNLHTDYLDSWVLHSPLPSFEETMKVWRTMEEAVDNGTVKQIGISNCYDMDTFRLLYQQAKHKPAVLQNRLYAESNFDEGLRRFCKDHNIKYQSFWTLTANRKALATDEVKQMAAAKGLSPQTYMYAFLMSLGYITPLDGSTTHAHMMEDVAVMERMQGGETMFTEHDQIRMAEILGFPNPKNVIL
jgi:diketogulonate reductase-like aldo/keto reductase